MKEYNVAIVGALGLVGAEMLSILEQRDFPVKEIRALDKEELAGSPVLFRGQVIYTETAHAENFEDIDIALVSVGADAASELVPLAAKKGAVAIDNSRFFRKHDDVPLVCPEANAHDLEWHNGIVANPNCTTLACIPVFKPIYDLSRIVRIVAATYQSASGQARRGMLELRKQSVDVATGAPVTPPSAFPYQLAFNLIPFIDVFEEAGYTREEWKLVNETRKILGDPEIRLTDTTVRVPVFVSHSVVANIETEDKLTPEEVREALENAPGVTVVDDIENLRFPQPIEAAGKDDSYVGRIREDFSTENGISLFLTSDNVRKGAALNAVQIAEELVARDLVEGWQSRR
jgi:aspartate-semialdehyde dehydrogenase